jgi:hypothetical protein
MVDVQSSMEAIRIQVARERQSESRHPCPSHPSVADASCSQSATVSATKKRQKRDESLWKRLQSLRCADSDLLQTPSLAAACRLSTKIQLENKAEPAAELPLASSQATNLKFTHLMSPIQKTPRSGIKTSLEWSQLFDWANPATLPVQKT